MMNNPYDTAMNELGRKIPMLRAVKMLGSTWYQFYNGFGDLTAPLPIGWAESWYRQWQSNTSLTYVARRFEELVDKAMGVMESEWCRGVFQQFLDALHPSLNRSEWGYIRFRNPDRSLRIEPFWRDAPHAHY